MYYNTSLDYQSILKEFYDSLSISNLRKNKELLYSISPSLNINIFDYFQAMKTFKYSQDELKQGLHYSKDYYFDYVTNRISYREKAKRSIIVFRRSLDEGFITHLFPSSFIERFSYKGDLQYVHFITEQSAKDSFKLYESYQNEHNELPTAFMECENLKEKILGVTAEIENGGYELPIRTGNGVCFTVLSPQKIYKEENEKTSENSRGFVPFYKGQGIKYPVRYLEKRNYQYNKFDLYN